MWYSTRYNNRCDILTDQKTITTVWGTKKYLERIHMCDITPANMSPAWDSGTCKVISVIFHLVKIIRVCLTSTFSDKCDTKATLEQMCVQDGSANRGENSAWQSSPEILPVWTSAWDLARKKRPPRLSDSQDLNSCIFYLFSLVCYKDFFLARR